MKFLIYKVIIVICGGNMYKLIIVDDERMIREGLKAFVDWSSLGFTVAGMASNGNEAFDLVKELNPDVILTDIKMPFCTGVELMKRINDAGINIKIVILSGYNEYDYVKAALEVGAVDYLLKPIKVEKLIEVFTKIKNDCDKRIKESIKFNEAFTLLKKQFFLKLLQGMMQKNNEILEQAAELGIDFKCNYYYTVIVELDDYHEIIDRFDKQNIGSFILSMKKIIAEICMKYGEGYAFETGEREITVIIGAGNNCQDNIKSLISELKQHVDSAFNLTTTISVGPLSEDIFRISSSYESARVIRNLKFIIGKNRILYPENAVEDLDNTVIEILSEDKIENRLILLLQNRNITEIDRLVDSIFRGRIEKEAIYMTFYQVIRFVRKYLDKNNIMLRDVIDEEALKYEYLLKKETLQDIIINMKDILLKTIEYLNCYKGKSANRIVEDIKEYSEIYYGNNISLDIIAQKLGMHPKYLSRIFKQETGMNFIDYLTSLRIDKAKKLMKDPALKTYKISEMVGYYSSKHFSTVFKSITGISPKEYRTSILGYNANED